MEQQAALPIVGIERELAGLREPLDRALGWAGLLTCVAMLLPVGHRGMGGLWYWHLMAAGRAHVPAVAQMVTGGGLLLLSRWRRPRLDKAIATLFLLGLGTTAVLTNKSATDSLLILFPQPFASGGLLFLLSAGAAASALAWRSGPLAEDRPRAPAITLSLLALTTTLILLLFPHETGSLAGAVLAEQPPPLKGVPTLRASSLTAVLLTLLPVTLSLYALYASLRPRPIAGFDERAESSEEHTAWAPRSGLAWVIGMPIGVTVTLGFKGAITQGDGVLLLLSLRTAVLLLGLLLVVPFAVSGALAQLHDRLGAEAPRPTLLLRDDLLHRVLLDARCAGAPRVRRLTRGYRPKVVDLVRARFAALLQDVRTEHPAPRTQADLLARMRRHLVDNRDPLVPRAPLVPRWVHWLGRGRNLEITSAAALLLCLLLAGAVRLATLPHATSWPLSPEEPWMTELYERRLPAIGVAAGGTAYPGRRSRIRRSVEKAAGLAAPAPELAAAIERLTPLVTRLPEERFALAATADEINRAARAAGVPFYLDIDPVAVRRGRAYLHYLHVKSYRIDRVRHARSGFAGYTALWVERADRSNIVDARLGWTRHDERHGMVVVDVVRTYWSDDVAPALAGSPNGPIRGIYARHGEALRADLARGVADLLDLDQKTARAALDARLACLLEHRSAPSGGDVGAVEPCEPAAAIDAAVVEILARKVETHELQHAIDGPDLPHPAPLQQAMNGYSEGAVTFAAAELSAYLAEVARSGQPRMALVHFLALAAVRPRSPEGFAGRVAIEHLTYLGESVDQLLELPEAELRARASEVRADLFGQPQGRLIVTDQSLDEP